MPTINFNPFPKQHVAYEYLTDNKKSFIGFGGAAGPGKSYLGCAWILIQCFTYPKVRYALARRELKTLKATTVKTMFKVMGDWGVTEQYYRYDKQYGEIKFWNGSLMTLAQATSRPHSTSPNLWRARSCSSTTKYQTRTPIGTGEY